MRVIGVDHAIAQEGRSKSDIAGAFKQFPAFQGKTGSERAFSSLRLMLSGSWFGRTNRLLPIAKDRRAPWFREPIGRQSDVESMPGNRKVDQSSGKLRDDGTKGSEGDSRMFVNQSRESLQACLWHSQTLEILVVVLQVQPVLLRCPSNLIRRPDALRGPVLGSKRLAGRAMPDALRIRDVAMRLLFSKPNEFL